jgi:hypothetical protein
MVSTADKNLRRLRLAERVILPAGLMLGIGGGLYAYWRTSSFWLGVFVFLVVYWFVAGSVRKIIFEFRSIHRMLLYPLWPAVATAILYLFYQQWQVLWLAVILGLVGGVFVERFIDARISALVAKDESFVSSDGEIGGRFSETEWKDLLILPAIVYGFIGGKSGSFSDGEANVLLTKIEAAKQEKDPLFRAILVRFKRRKPILHNRAEWNDIRAAGSYLERMKLLLSGRLSTDEYNRFMYSLILCFGDEVASVEGQSWHRGRGAGGSERSPELSAVFGLVNIFELDADAGRRHYEAL